MKNLYLIIISTFLLQSPLYSQNESVKETQHAKKTILPEIITDRPDATESSSTIPEKTLQIETGVIYEKAHYDNYKTDNWMLGTTLLRYGVWDNFELRLSGYYQYSSIKEQESGIDSTLSGFGPLLAGFKVYVIEEKGIRPEISILAEVTLRHLGNENFRPTHSYPKALLTASHTLSKKFSLGYNAGFAYSGESADGFFIYSVALGYSIIHRLRAYVEIFGDFDNGNSPNPKADGGFTYLIRNNLQFDISVCTSLDNKVDKRFISTGFSWRIPR